MPNPANPKALEKESALLNAEPAHVQASSVSKVKQAAINQPPHPKWQPLKSIIESMKGKGSGTSKSRADIESNWACRQLINGNFKITALVYGIRELKSLATPQNSVDDESPDSAEEVDVERDNDNILFNAWRTSNGQSTLDPREKMASIKYAIRLADFQKSWVRPDGLTVWQEVTNKSLSR